jgi:hypothetical protein
MDDEVEAPWRATSLVGVGAARESGRRPASSGEDFGAEGMQLRGMRSGDPDLAAHSTVAMIPGMAALRSMYFGTKQPSREAIIEELTQATLHGFL